MPMPGILKYKAIAGWIAEFAFHFSQLAMLDAFFLPVTRLPAVQNMERPTA